MTLPTITYECMTVLLQKATQQAPEVFAQEVMVELLEDQPVLMEALMSVLQPFLEVCAESEYEGQEVQPEMRKELMIMGQFCVAGIIMKSLNAQVEADEMNEAWG